MAESSGQLGAARHEWKSRVEKDDMGTHPGGLLGDVGISLGKGLFEKWRGDIIRNTAEIASNPPKHSAGSTGAALIF